MFRGGERVRVVQRGSEMYLARYACRPKARIVARRSIRPHRGALSSRNAPKPEAGPSSEERNTTFDEVFRRPGALMPPPAQAKAA
jgi:hypothetical protein